MSEVYSAEEFARSCRLRGVAPRAVVEEYIKDNQAQGVDFFVEADFEVVYELNEMRISQRTARGDRSGVNQNDFNASAPENTENSEKQKYCPARTQIILDERRNRNEQ